MLGRIKILKVEKRNKDGSFTYLFKIEYFKHIVRVLLMKINKNVVD